MEKDLLVPIDERHKYTGFDLNTPLDEVECTCKGDNTLACKSILPVAENTPNVIVYNNCKRTLVASMKRQIRRTPEPDMAVATDIQKFMDRYFAQYIEPHLRDFDYSYSEWYNHLTAAKQDSIDKVDTTNEQTLTKNMYGLFCKLEKQEVGGKTRAIANISNESKFVMGPVVWALESVATKHFPGYCGNKNWEEMELYYKECYDRGFTNVIQGDGSAFDLSQHNTLKYIDRLIYNYLADNDKIHHVEPEIFKTVATAQVRPLKAGYVVNGRIETLGLAYVQGTVFSGSSDTTFANTIRMAVYNMYTMEKAGLIYDVDYQVKCKGDDFFVLTGRDMDWDAVYYKYWIKAIEDPMKYHYKPFGIGQVLKFLVTGGYDSLDFCSTTVIPYKIGNEQLFKIVRKPDRMAYLSHYSREALRMSNIELKQYYIDVAMSVESFGKGMPFYQDYADAYRYHASMIPGEPKTAKQGKPGKILPHDGHKHSHGIQLDNKYAAYGRDFQMALLEKTSSNRIPDNYVYDHLLSRYSLTKNDISCHALFLKVGGLYDHINGAK
jgi:hypothetical protein